MKIVQLITFLISFQFSAFSDLIYSSIQIAGDERYQYTPTSCLQDKYRSFDQMETLNVHNLCASASSLSECRALLNVEKEKPIELQVHKINTACDLPEGSGYSLPATAIAAARLGGALLPAVHATYTKPGETIRNIEDFYRHTTLHKKRVVALGLYLYDKRPDLFEGLDRELLKKALLSHDNAKVLPEFTDKKGRPFYRALYEDGFGRRPPQDLVDSLNHSDAKIMEERINKL